ncbi:MAG: APC family permease [Firmicutes bacterium]|nr:APC family permease [Bacillota bacterium]
MAGSVLKEQRKLKRALSRGQLIWLGVGGSIGSGWLFGVLYSVKMAGPAAVLAWLLGAIMLFFIAIVYAELGAMLPEAGAVVRYPEYTHGSVVGFLMSVITLIGYSTIPSIESEAVVEYLGPKTLFQPSGVPNLEGWLVEAAFIVIFFFINFYGVRIFARANTYVTIAKVLIPIVSIVALASVFHIGNFTAAAGNGFAPYGFQGIFVAIASAGIAFSLVGFRQVIDFSAEAAHPKKDIVPAIIIAFSMATLIYIGLQAVWIGALPSHVMDHGWAAVKYAAPFVNVAQLAHMKWLVALLVVAAIISPLGSGTVYFGSAVRAIVGLANNGYVSKKFGHVDEKSGIPKAATWFTLGMALLWTGPFPIWSLLVSFASSALLLTYVVGPVSAVVLRHVAPDLPRPLKLKGLPILALIAFMVSVNLVYWTGWDAVRVLLGILFVALIIFATVQMRSEASRQKFGFALRKGIWLMVLFAFMLLISYLGSFGGIGVLKYPWDSIIVSLGAIGFFFWGVASGFLSDSFVEKLKMLGYPSEQLSDEELHRQSSQGENV